MRPLITIITATFNSEATVEDNLRSVSEQSYKNVEHVFIDGLSSDNTLKIVDKYPHVTKVISEKDNGIYDAMNKGISIASGDVVGILNSDDLYADETVLEKVATVFNNDNVMAVYGDLQYVNHRNLQDVVRYWKAGQFDPRNFHFGWMPPHPTFFVRRELYEKFGVFDTRFRSAADYELMLRFLVRYRVQAKYLPVLMVKMRTGGVSNANAFNRWRANREDRKAWDVNGLKPYFFTIPLKPIRKISQYFIRK